ncbi:MAG: hypothetical protein RMK29_18010 [Myxococcales bacterium]|nr:hypothetical protein [Myxococcota bacterium]MDW8283606.1 hypothetical protein [Myxococcales bacterium]
MRLWLAPFLLLALAGCAGLSRLVPPQGRGSTEVTGETARLRVYVVPPLPLPPLRDVLAVYVELHNRGPHSLRVDYADLWLGDRTVRQGPLRPGDVLRPARVGSRPLLLAGLQARPSAGGNLQGAPRPEVLADWDSGGSGLDFFAPTARTRAHNHWVLRNDYNTGMQLTSAGWNFFGLPRPGSAMSLFEILASTLPDGTLVPGGTLSGFLFFPATAAAHAALGLRWEVHRAFTGERLEILSLPLEPAR